MNRQIRRLAIAISVCYLALFVQLNNVQVISADRLTGHPDNTRQVERDFNRPRGAIITADDVVIARSKPTDGRFAFQREYPTKELFAHVTGSYSYLFGADGVEKVYNDELSGQTATLKLRGFTNPFVERSTVGNVILTLRQDVQAAAREALGERKGSVVAIDPRSGAILALWSFPSFDPNLTSSNDPTLARAVRDYLNALPDKPMLARSYRERFFPGSTFKVVTAAAGLASGRVTETSPSFPRTNAYTPPGTTRPIRNFDGSTCGGALLDLLRVSCNTSFAEMGAEILGPELMTKQAAAFGFNSVPPIDLTRPAQSVFPTDYGRQLRPPLAPDRAGIFEDTPALAQASIGQNNVSATPLQMALVAAAVANGGSIMRPHVLDRVEDIDGEVVDRFESRVWRTPISPAEAEVLQRAMYGVVESGTATAMRISGLAVGAKTGTAQLGTNPPRSHAWVIGFAGPPDRPAEIAVAVLVEGQPGASEQTGGRVAAPIAKAVINAALVR